LSRQPLPEVFDDISELQIPPISSVMLGMIEEHKAEWIRQEDDIDWLDL